MSIIVSDLSDDIILTDISYDSRIRIGSDALPKLTKMDKHNTAVLSPCAKFN